MKTPEERIQVIEEKEKQREKDWKDIGILVIVAVFFVLLVWATATSVAGYFNTEKILEILQK